MSQMLVELLLQIKLVALLQLQVLLRDLFQLGLNFSDLLGAILIQQHALAVDQPGSFHILLDGFTIKKPYQVHIDELVIPPDSLLRLHTNAIQHEIFWLAPLPMRSLRCVMMVFRVIRGAGKVVVASSAILGKFIA